VRLDGPRLANMKLRHAAVVALVGWYLMVPPHLFCLRKQ
jgi:hypothetical protein